MNRRQSVLTSLLFFILFFTITVHAQPGWNWPEDVDRYATSQEKQAFSRVSMQLENYQDAYQALAWLYKNNPDLHESIYIDGGSALEKLIQITDDPARKELLEDSLMIIYDLRMQYFDNVGEIMGRKAYAAFKLNYNKPAKFEMLANLYDTAYAMNKEEFAYFNMTPYMTLAKYYYQRKPEEMPATRVLDIHDRISYSIDQQKSAEPDRMKREQDKIDAMLSSMGEILTCEFIEEKLVPKMEANPTDLNNAKKVFTYSLKAKCSDEPYFLTAGSIIYKNDPSYELANVLGNKSLINNDYALALDYFKAALGMTDDQEKQYNAQYNIATTYSKMENKPAARSAAFQALSLRPGDKKSYNLIGNLYYTSFAECKADKSRVKDRGVFLAAYDMYAKAGNEEQMAACKEQFPSSVEIFDENMEVGQEFTVDCWIGTSVTIKRRD